MNQNQEVDLNLRHYVGERSDVIKEVKVQISNYLRNPEISSTSRSIYSAIYNALTYYQNISDLSISGETADKTFLENMIFEFNQDFQYLAEKYNSDDPTVPRVIQAKGRIKSPISALNKILEKISEYIHDGMDLKPLNNSLRDFIGLRIIVDPPQEIKSQGKQAELDFCYQVFDDLLTHRGIIRQIDGKTSERTDYRFVKVDTVHDPHKLEKMKKRPKIEGFRYNPEDLGIFIPSERPKFVEKYDEYFKDYQMYPKAKLYQRLHTCAHPYFADYIPPQRTPNYIIPSTSTDTSIEYQVCTLEEEEFAEHGKASHTEYKGERTFHRLGIPIFMKFDENLNKIRLTRLDEAIEEFYGYTFQSKFNIDYQTFLRTFDAEQRNNILAGNLIVNFNAETQEYVVSPAKSLLIIDDEQPISYIQNLLETASPDELRRFYDKNGILDGTIECGEKVSDFSPSKAIQIYTVQTPLSLEKKFTSEIPITTSFKNKQSNVGKVDFDELK